VAEATVRAEGRGLRRALGWVEYFTLAWGSIVGVGWVVVMDDWLTRGGPAGAALGFVAGGLLLVPVGVVYGRMMAVAEGELAYTAGLVRDWARFLVGWMMLLAYLVVCPYEAVAVGQLCGYLFPPLEALPLYRVGGSVVHLPALALGLAAVAGVTAVNYVGVHHSARLQNALTFVLFAGALLFAALGAARGSAANLSPPFPRPGALGALAAVVMMLQVVPYFLAGFESIARCSEERGAGFAHRRFLSVTLAALLGAVAFYALVVLVTASLHPWQSLAPQKLATLYAFRAAFQAEWVVNLLLAVAVVSLVKVLNGCFLAATRQLFALGRSGLLPAGLAAVHPRWLTPARAVALVGLASAGGCLLGKSVLVPISEVGSLAFAAGWLATCLAYCHPRWRPGRAGRALALAGAAVVGGLIVLKLVPGVPGSLSEWEFVALGLWVAFGLVLYRAASGRRAPPSQPSPPGP
jgi:basic amino acid/polyamine antiporter, APA family